MTLTQLTLQTYSWAVTRDNMSMFVLTSNSTFGDRINSGQNARLIKGKRQKGATLVELIFVMPLFLILVGAIIEISYAYRTKTTLNAATFDAVREGAVSNASKSSMKSALSAGMVPVFVLGNADSAGVLDAYRRSTQLELALSGIARVQGLDTITIISPTRSVYDRFKSEIMVLEDQRVTVAEAIPNDNLMYRSTATRSVNVGGQNVQMNVQDANLIKIKSLWCHRLLVPGLRDLADRLIFTSNFITTSPEQRTCNAVGALGGEFEGVYVAITSQAISRSQSPIFADDLE